MLIFSLHASFHVKKLLKKSLLALQIRISRNICKQSSCHTMEYPDDESKNRAVPQAISTSYRSPPHNWFLSGNAIQRLDRALNDAINLLHQISEIISSCFYKLLTSCNPNLASQYFYCAKPYFVHLDASGPAFCKFIDTLLH